jgi:DNA-directed RNA polymerase alpha subunit
MKKYSKEQIYTTRIANALYNAKLYTLTDISNVTKKELLRYRNLGEKSVNVIENALIASGLKFKECE